MTPLPSRALVLAFAFAALSAPAAQAFTLQNADGTKADSSAGYAEPSKKPEQSKDGMTTLQLGAGTTVQFGSPSPTANDYYTAKERMLTPLGRPGN